MQRQISVHSMKSPLSPEDIENFTNKHNLIQNHILHLTRTTAHTHLSRRRSSTKECCQAEVILSPENRVNIRDLTDKIDTVLEGKLFLSRCIIPPRRESTWIETIVEDPEGITAIRLALFYFTEVSKFSTISNVENSLPVGTILVIKNPMFKHTSLGELVLRCKNPAEIELLSPKRVSKLFPGLQWQANSSKEHSSHDIWGVWECDRFISPASEFIIHSKLQHLGNKAVAEMRFLDAVRWYTLALEYGQNTNLDITINRGSAYYNLQCYSKSLKDTHTVLTIRPFHVKAVYRKVKCLLSLKRYEEANDFLDEIFKKCPELESDTELILLSDAAETCLSESSKREVNFASYLKDSLIRNKSLLDAPDFTGPVSIQKVSGNKGRGLVAAESISEGQLLVCSKAFALQCNYNTGQENNNYWVTIPSPRILRRANSHSAVSHRTNHFDALDREELIGRIANKLTTEPNKCPEFYNLWAGPELGILGNDTSLNQTVDIRRIERIVRYNSFTFSSEMSNSIKIPSQSNPTMSMKAHGIWLLPSYINHSCSEANAHWTVVGDLMLIRAVKPIRRGDEVLISYTCPTISYKERQHLFKFMGFVCDCSLCQTEATETKEIRQRRRELISSLTEIMELHPLIPTPWLFEALSDINEIEALQKKNPKLHLSLLSVTVRKLAEVILDNGHVPGILQILEKMHGVSRDIAFTAGLTVTLSIFIVKYYLMHGKQSNIDKWVKQIKADLLVAYGSVQPLSLLEPKVLRELELIKNHNLFD
jgi:tetratricopeptide (TPR) repeat protein